MKLAVVLFNLGGPDRPEAVRPFLTNLFSDPAIIAVPQPFRALLAWAIARRRTPTAQEIYGRIGGRSPIVPETEAQARALEAALAGRGIEARAFIAMRYWHPFGHEAAAAVKAWGADRIVLLPLYPQYSTTTSASSLKDWHAAAARAGLSLPVETVCCWPGEPGFIAAQATLLKDAIARVPAGQPFRVLFSAHGLPERVIAKGDPYQWQVEQTSAATVAALGHEGLDWRVTYQSRVGPLAWIKPYTDAEIEQAGTEGKAVIVVPIAFVSEHSETLVELDLEYAELAHEKGVPAYVRVAAAGTHPAFIAGLADAVANAVARGRGIAPDTGRRLCGAKWSQCPCREQAVAVTA